MIALTCLILFSFVAWGGALQHGPLQRKLDALAHLDGRLGVCVQAARGASCLRGEERFSLQSVMKLIVAVAVMDAVNRGSWRLD